MHSFEKCDKLLKAEKMILLQDWSAGVTRFFCFFILLGSTFLTEVIILEKKGNPLNRETVFAALPTGLPFFVLLIKCVKKSDPNFLKKF